MAGFDRCAFENKSMVAFNEEIKEFTCRTRSFEEELASYYLERNIKDIYARLSEKEKELFDLCIDGNIKTGEMAEILGLEPHTCSMRKKRLKEKCLDIMIDILFY